MNVTDLKLSVADLTDKSKREVGISIQAFNLRSKPLQTINNALYCEHTGLTDKMSDSVWIGDESMGQI